MALATYVFPVFGAKPVASIETADGDRRQAGTATGASRENVAQPVDLDAAARRARPFDEQVAHQLVTGALIEG